MKTRHRQSGVALISVLLVFALIALLAGELMTRSRLDVRRTSNLLDGKQAWYYALGGEQLARQILRRDFTDSPNRSDQLSDSWAKSPLTFNINEGSMEVTIRDLQGVYNLNNITATGGLGQFQRLLQKLGVNTAYAALYADWVDPDQNTLPGGAEDTEYQGLGNYLAANRAETDATALRLLREFDFLDFDKLRDHVVALPPASLYNINTMDGRLIEALSATISEADAARINARQQQGGYVTKAEWLAAEGASLRSVENQLDTRSSYFEIVVKAKFGGRLSALKTVVFRNPADGQLTVISRQQGSAGIEG